MTGNSYTFLTLKMVVFVKSDQQVFLSSLSFNLETNSRSNNCELQVNKQ